MQLENALLVGVLVMGVLAAARVRFVNKPGEPGPPRTTEDKLLRAGWFASLVLYVLGDLAIRFQRTPTGVEARIQGWGHLLTWFIYLTLLGAFFLFAITSGILAMRWMGRRRAR